MDTIVPVQPLSDAQKVLVSAVAHQIERMSKEEVQALVTKATVELQNENAALKKQLEQLEADKLRLYYEIGRLSFDPEEFERTFDPSEYTVPVEELMADLDQLLNESGEPTHG